jgi:hypothetical protein
LLNTAYLEDIAGLRYKRIAGGPSVVIGSTVIQ